MTDMMRAAMAKYCDGFLHAFVSPHSDDRMTGLHVALEELRFLG